MRKAAGRQNLSVTFRHDFFQRQVNREQVVDNSFQNGPQHVRSRMGLRQSKEGSPRISRPNWGPFTT